MIYCHQLKIFSLNFSLLRLIIVWWKSVHSEWLPDDKSWSSVGQQWVLFLKGQADMPVSERLTGTELIPGGPSFAVFKEQLRGDQLLLSDKQRHYWQWPSADFLSRLWCKTCLFQRFLSLEKSLLINLQSTFIFKKINLQIFPDQMQQICIGADSDPNISRDTTDQHQ